MFWLGFIIGLVIGANLALILYAMIVAGKRSDNYEYNNEFTRK